MSKYEELTEMAAEYEMRRSLRTQLREEEEGRECTFAPKTSGRPRSVLGGRERERYAPPSSDEKELAEHCTFKPRVNSFHVRGGLYMGEDRM